MRNDVLLNIRVANRSSVCFLSVWVIKVMLCQCLSNSSWTYLIWSYLRRIDYKRLRRIHDRSLGCPERRWARRSRTAIVNAPNFTFSCDFSQRKFFFFKFNTKSRRKKIITSEFSDRLPTLNSRRNLWALNVGNRDERKLSTLKIINLNCNEWTSNMILLGEYDIELTEPIGSPL